MVMILFESLRPAEERRSFWLEPETILQCIELQDVNPLLKMVEDRVADGYAVAGFLCYEAGFAFLPAAIGNRQSAIHNLPLAWFALTKHMHRLPPGKLPDGFCKDPEEEVTGLSLNQSLEEYKDAIGRIKGWIEKGHTYQVNYTMRYRGNFHGSTRALYCRLRERQSVNYAVYLESEDWAIVSLSPELFFRTSGPDILVKPMKGTAGRGRTNQEDLIHAGELRESLKEQSENLMIVDMLRNDLGKICEIGSVAVTDPMCVELYETLLQMTSTIRARLFPGAGLAQILEALFPSGSVTGAPKIRTMQIIRELEREPRGIYTGAIGMITPQESAFSVAIRTAVIHRRQHTIEMGVGSGILYEADPVREYQECILKGKFLTERSEPFQLLETILWTPESGYARLSMHLDRFMDSASYFLFSLDRETVERFLLSRETDLRQNAVPKGVRLLAGRDGVLQMQVTDLEPLSEPPRHIRFASRSIDSSDPYYFHKTTRRRLYEEELEKARREEFFDVIFRNEKGEMTEGAISNLWIRKAGICFTPPVSCGLLAGTYRRFLLETHPFPIEERVLHEEDVRRAEDVFLTNALRGIVKVLLRE